MLLVDNSARLYEIEDYQQNECIEWFVDPMKHFRHMARFYADEECERDECLERMSESLAGVCVYEESLKPLLCAGGPFEVMYHLAYHLAMHRVSCNPLQLHI